MRSDYDLQYVQQVLIIAQLRLTLAASLVPRVSDGANVTSYREERHAVARIDSSDQFLSGFS